MPPNVQKSGYVSTGVQDYNNRKRFRRNINALTYRISVGIIVLLILTTFGSYRMNRKLQEEYNSEELTGKVIDNLELFLSNMKDVEIGQRSYLFSGGENDLQFYRNSKKKTENLIANLKTVLVNSPNAKNYLEQIEQSIKEYISVFDNELQLQRERKIKEMRDSLQKNTGKKSMDNIRLLVVRMENEQKTLRQEHYQQLDKETYYAFLISWAGIALSLIIGLLLMIYRTRYISELKDRATILQDAEEHAQNIIKERTFALTDRNKELQAEIAKSSRMEEKLLKLNRMFKTINECNSILVHATEWSDLLNMICKSIVDTGGYRSAWIGFAENDQKKSIQPVARWGFEGNYVDNLNLSWADNEKGRGPTGTAIRTERPVIVKDIKTDESFSGWWKQVPNHGSTSFIALPLMDSHGESFGALNIYSEQTNSFGEDEVNLLMNLAHDAAYGIMMLQTRSDKKHTLEALESVKDRYKLLFTEDITGNYICTAEGEIIFCNPAFAKILGFDSEDEVLKHNAISLCSGFEDWYEMISLLKEEKKLENYEIKLKRADGQPVFAIQNLIGDFNESGTLETMKGYLFDITEYKKLEDQFRQSQKMESIGQLAGGIAHDFNNLLTVISGYSDLLLSDLDRDDARWEDIEEIRKAGKRAAELTRQLLAFSRRQILDIHIINLNDIVRNLNKMLNRLIREDIKIVTVFDENLESILADPGQMEQILINLTVNARDAMPDRGILTIETQNVMLDREYTQHHLFVKPGKYIMLAVSDTGTGMLDEVKERIFEPFFTTKEKGKGTGLGLAMIYGIVKQSGGNILVYSEPGKGTSFKIYLPSVTEMPESLSKNKPENSSQRGTETILLVEDDESVQKMTKKTLERLGYTVIVGKGSEEGLAEFNKYIESISILITDVVMPNMSGKELADRISKIRPDVRVLFISGYTDNAIVYHGILEPGTHFMQKPFSPDQLAKKVRMILDEK